MTGIAWRPHCDWRDKLHDQQDKAPSPPGEDEGDITPPGNKHCVSGRWYGACVAADHDDRYRWRVDNAVGDVRGGEKDGREQAEDP